MKKLLVFSIVLIFNLLTPNLYCGKNIDEAIQEANQEIEKSESIKQKEIMDWLKRNTQRSNTRIDEHKILLVQHQEKCKKNGNSQECKIATSQVKNHHFLMKQEKFLDEALIEKLENEQLEKTLQLIALQIKKVDLQQDQEKEVSEATKKAIKTILTVRLDILNRHKANNQKFATDIQEYEKLFAQYKEKCNKNLTSDECTVSRAQVKNHRFFMTQEKFLHKTSMENLEKKQIETLVELAALEGKQ